MTGDKMSVWKAPADFNRAARRAVGLFGNVWAWKPQPTGMPRYVRRHYADHIITAPRTRRERKHRARILRAMGAMR